MSIHITANGLKKVFNRRVIFQKISFSLTVGQTLLVTGRNGSGKSTLVKILAGVLAPTEGTVTVSSSAGLQGDDRCMIVGLVAPYLMMYDEFSARENLRFALSIRGIRPNDTSIDRLLEKVNLYDRRNDLVRTFSSGMKQRVKLAFALVHQPTVLLLDEPMANLDSDGIGIVRQIMEEQRERGLLVVATNDLSDIDRYDVQVNLNERR